MAGHLIAEVDISSGQIKREYLWLGDTPVATIAGANPDQLISSTNAPAIYYIHTDQFDTPRLITDTAKRKRWDWNPLTNEPFGATQPNQTPTSGQTQFILNLRFAGQYHDSETGTFYNHFRTYQPQWGRYVQSDPIGLQGGLNTYAYVEGNPLSNVDPKGLISYQGQQLLDRIFGPAPDTSECATAECAAGLPPVPSDNRSQSEIDQSRCELICGVLGPGNVIPGGFAISKLVSWIGINSATSFGCKLYCNKNDKCKPK